MQWREIVSATARLAIGMHGPPDMAVYVENLSREINMAVNIAPVGTCRIEFVPLRYLRASRCLQCTEFATMEAHCWDDSPSIAETLRLCVRHAVDTMFAWYLCVLPLYVYHGTRVRVLRGDAPADILANVKAYITNAEVAYTRIAALTVSETDQPDTAAVANVNAAHGIQTQTSTDVHWCCTTPTLTTTTTTTSCTTCVPPGTCD